MLLSELGRIGRFIDPWREFEKMENQMRSMQRELRRTLPRYGSPTAGEFPSVNVWAKEDDAIVTAEIPGVDPEDIDVTVIGNTFTLKGSRKTDDPTEGESYHRRERWSGNFTRSLELPFNTDADKVDAKFKNGVLYITLPRAEAEKPKKISIK